MNNVDVAISKFGAKLDTWLEENLATLASGEPADQSKALIAGIRIIQELDNLKQQGLQTIRGLLQSQNVAAEQTNVALLVRAFELATKIGDALHDELLETDGPTKFVRLKNEIASVLDTTTRGRGELDVLLDHPVAGVRASAAAYLLIANVMPEKAVAVLRKVENDEGANSAYFKAHWALLAWELEQKAIGGG
jgi:hypothetical protein